MADGKYRPKPTNPKFIKPASVRDAVTGRPAARITAAVVTGYSTPAGFGVHQQTGAIRFRVIGGEKAQKTIKRLYKQDKKKLKRGLHNAGLFLKRESQAIVPVDTGYLRSSAYMRVRETKDTAFYDVGYLAPYAVYVHEDLEAKHAEGTQAKYLEEPARRWRRHMHHMVVREFN